MARSKESEKIISFAPWQRGVVRNLAAAAERRGEVPNPQSIAGAASVNVKTAQYILDGEPPLTPVRSTKPKRPVADPTE